MAGLTARMVRRVSERQPVNLDVLNKLRVALPDVDLVSELITMFLEDAPPMLATIRAAVESDDLAALQHEAHSLKGNCLNLGAVVMEEYCAELETFPGPTSTHSERVALLEAEFERVRVVLEEQRAP